MPIVVKAMMMMLMLGVDDLKKGEVQHSIAS